MLGRKPDGGIERVKKVADALRRKTVHKVKGYVFKPCPSCIFNCRFHVIKRMRSAEIAKLGKMCRLHAEGYAVKPCTAKLFKSPCRNRVRVCLTRYLRSFRHLEAAVYGGENLNKIALSYRRGSAATKVYAVNEVIRGTHFRLGNMRDECTGIFVIVLFCCSA